jgi:hypothetical protein
MAPADQDVVFFTGVSHVLEVNCFLSTTLFLDIWSLPIEHWATKSSSSGQQGLARRLSG